MFELGNFIYIKNNRAISHRSILKILLNPILRRLFGIAIASEIKNKKFIKYKIIKQTEPHGWALNVDFDYDYKIKV